ncbi:alpha/beta hydrolase [Cupriavidus necator]
MKTWIVSLAAVVLASSLAAVRAQPVAPALDAQTRQFLDKLNAAGGKGLPQMTPDEARAWWDNFQGQYRGTLPKVSVKNRDIPVAGRNVTLTIVAPADQQRPLPVIVFFHGGGWVMGNYAPTHERFVRELADGVQAVVVVVHYARSPEHKYPVAVNESYAATRWIAEHAHEFMGDPGRLAVAGGSVGGTMAAAVSLMALEKRAPVIRYQVLLWPITDANFQTASYRQFANGYFLSAEAMQWLWDQYTTDPAQRLQRYAAPLQASVAQMQGLPPALVQTAQYDIVRDEGEAYAHKMMQAGVSVTATRYLGTIHDFGLTNDLSHTAPARAAMRQVIEALKAHLQ